MLTHVHRIQGDMNGWMDLTDPLDDTLTFNQTGLVRALQFLCTLAVLVN